MAQEAQAGVLGISLIDDQLRIVEGKKSLNELQISRVAHGRSRQPFGFDVFSDKSMTRRFAEDITRLYELQKFEVKDVAFSLDSRMVLIKKIPIDKTLDEQMLADHISWEVTQYAISPINEYIIDFEHLNSAQESRSFNYVLVVIVRKKIIKFLRQMFNHTDLALKYIDVDIFSAQRALQLNYDYPPTGRIGLIDIAESKVNFAILDGKNYFLSQDYVFPPNNSNLESRQESAARLISKELRRVILDHQLGRGVEDLKEIYLYGEAVDDPVLEGLQNSYNIRIDRANPFRKVKMMKGVKEEIEKSRSERFMICVGAAIRGIQ
ncbi:MAG: type IV pilus biogenesis protein PilM [bacterium]